MAPSAPRIFPWPWPVYHGHGSNDGAPVDVLQGKGEKDFFYTTTGMAIDYDGGIGAYHMPTTGAPYGRPPGLDNIQNASRTGHEQPPPTGGNWPDSVWPQLVIDKSIRPNRPYRYTFRGDPNFVVSQTSLSDPSRQVKDTARWVDAVSVPYVVLPPGFWQKRLRVGDLATVYNEANASVVQAIFADSGTRDHLGEGSGALHRLLHPRNKDPITWIIYPGSVRTPHWPVPAAVINAEGQRRFAAWGGVLRIADRLVDLLQEALDGLTVGGQLPPPLLSLRDQLNSAQASLRASKGTPYPQVTGGGPATRVPVLSERDDAIAELKSFVDQVNAMAGSSLLRGREATLRDLAERARTALAVPD